ncbi:hypothetical protein D3C75_596750 [compost metagenome]
MFPAALNVNSTIHGHSVQVNLAFAYPLGNIKISGDGHVFECDIRCIYQHVAFNVTRICIGLAVQLSQELVEQSRSLRSRQRSLRLEGTIREPLQDRPRCQFANRSRCPSRHLRLIGKGDRTACILQLERPGQQYCRLLTGNIVTGMGLSFGALHNPCSLQLVDRLIIPIA